MRSITGPRPSSFPTPWDHGTARLLAHLGFKALATTSMGYAFSIGQRDSTLSRDQTFANAIDLAAASDRAGERGYGKSASAIQGKKSRKPFG